MVPAVIEAESVVSCLSILLIIRETTGHLFNKTEVSSIIQNSTRCIAACRPSQLRDAADGIRSRTEAVPPLEPPDVAVTPTAEHLQRTQHIFRFKLPKRNPPVKRTYLSLIKTDLDESPSDIGTHLLSIRKSNMPGCPHSHQPSSPASL
ncbi:hypothetical protein VTK56DRAFT_1112 [Thermocarpiscus australiensis]